MKKHDKKSFDPVAKTPSLIAGVENPFNKGLVPIDNIENMIFIIRGYKVIFDTDLAALYQVATKILNQAVKRNIERFPEDFMFRLTKEEAFNSRSQIVTLKKQGSNIKYLPYVFTEQGIAMLSSVLNSKRAIQVNIIIMRTFVKIRQMNHLNPNQEIKRLVF